MASIYDKASLVLIPSGTKTSKVYSQKPTNGDGDFTFSRSTAATRVNASGNIEKETQNLFLQSNSFTTAPNNSVGISIDSNQAGYDGSNNAWLITKNGTYSRLEQAISFSGLHTISVYAKAGSYDWIMINDGVGNAYFDLANGVLGSSFNYVDHSIESVGNGWYRCSATSNGSRSVMRFYPMLDDANFGVSPWGSVYIQDAQLEQGLVARDYIETTTTAIYGGITDNVPRLDYTDSSCPALLLEPQRTNLSIQSEYFDVAPSVKDASTIEVNGTTSPSGLDDACLFTETTANDRHGFYQYITISAGALTASIFTKEIDRRYVHFQSDATGSGASSYVDLQDGSVVSEGSGWSLSTEDYGNGWYRITATCTAVAGNKYFIWGVSQNGTSNTYAGSTSSDFTFYGFQLEAGSYATSYIPTYGSAVTRNAENTNTPASSSVADLIGQTEGTAFIDVEYLDGALDDIFILHRSAADGIGVSKNNSSFLVRVYQNGTLTNTAGGTTADSFKLAVTYNSNGVKMFINGALNVSNEFAISFNSLLDDIYLSANPFYISRQKKNIKQFMLFPTALTDQEAIDLTTI